MTRAVFVMGATSAIAQELVILMRERGYEVVAAGRDMDSLQSSLGNHAGVHVMEVQATNSESVNAAFAKAEDLGLSIEGYAHCVGSILVAPLGRTTDAQWDEVMSVNLTSAMYGLRRFVQGCKAKQHGGSAVLVSTCATGLGVPNHEAIAAAKGGLEGLAKSTAATSASEGIRVNVVAPGLTDSPIASAFLKSDVMRAASAKQYPLQGINTPKEVAEAMAWLLSDESSRVTGTTLNVDGGFRNIRPLVK
ncbi:MAG: SDR family oxidoreductase [Limnobacter sp.]|nr:SDR family oxidoreductase [Limnobacter sp.]